MSGAPRENTTSVMIQRNSWGYEVRGFRLENYLFENQNRESSKSQSEVRVTKWGDSCSMRSNA
jgi:hypothetical protein